MAHIVLEGNISEGFKAYGPYEDFDAAVSDTDYGSETWVMELHAPEDRTQDPDLDENWKARLQSGDEVTWNDPDEGKCSGVYKIVDVKIFGPEEECPNCRCGTLGLEDGRLVCRGECGHSFGSPDMDDAVFSLRNDEGSEVEAFGRELS